MEAWEVMKRLSFSCLFLFAIPLQIGIAGDRSLDGIHGFIHAAMKHWEVPGVAVAVVKDGKIILARGYGICEIGSKKAVTTKTLFDIASCTKPFASASVALLVDQGKAGWDDPVSRHLPEIRFPGKSMTQHVTIRDLLCHRTGLERGDLAFSREDTSETELLKRISFLRVIAPFRTKSTYSNLMYAIVRKCVSKRTAKPWPQFVKEKLLDRLGMESTTFLIGKSERGSFAPRHWREEGRIRSRGLPIAPEVGGPVTIYSSASDLAKWLQVQLAEGSYDGQRILSRKSIREMHALHHSVPVRKIPKGNPYAARFYGSGLGWFTLDYRGRKLVMHTGAWGSAMALVPEENLGVVVLSNLDWNGMSGILIYQILDRYCGPKEAIPASRLFKQFASEGPGYAYRNRDRERARLKLLRNKSSRPSLPLPKLTGHFRSPLFGDLHLSPKADRLLLKMGRFTTELTHWDQDTFYAKAPVRLNFDWLVKLAVKDQRVAQVTLKYVGWQEPDAIFYPVKGP